jgi:hypothetical protein
MPTPSRFQGVLVEDEGIDFVDDGSVLLPTAPGQIRYHAGQIWVQDTLATFPLQPAALPDFSKVLFAIDGTFVIDDQGDPLLLE